MSYTHSKTNRYLPRSNTTPPQLQPPQCHTYDNKTNIQQNKPIIIDNKQQINHCHKNSHFNNLHIQVNNINNKRKQIHELLDYVKQKDKQRCKYTNKYANININTNNNNIENVGHCDRVYVGEQSKFNNYRKRILQLQRIQQLYQQSQLDKKQNIKDKIIFSEHQYQYSNIIKRHKTATQSQPLHLKNINVSEIEDHMPISRPTSTSITNVNPISVRVDIGYRSRSPLIIPKPNLKYIGNKLISQQTGRNKQSSRNKSIDLKQRYSPYSLKMIQLRNSQQKSRQKLKQKQREMLNTKNIKHTVTTTNYSYNLKYSSKYIEEQSNVVDTDQQQNNENTKIEGISNKNNKPQIQRQQDKHVQRQQIRKQIQIKHLNQQNRNQSQIPTPKIPRFSYSTLLQQKTVMETQQKQQRQQTIISKIEIMQTQIQNNQQNNQISFDDTNRRGGQLAQEIAAQPYHPYRNLDNLSENSNNRTPHIIHQFHHQQIYEQGNQNQDEQIIAPYRTNFQIKVYPCDLNQNNIKNFIADRLAAVVQVDVQFMELKAIFMTGKFKKTMSIGDKRRILLRTLWERNLMVDQSYLDSSMRLDVQTIPTTNLQQKCQKYDSFDKFVQIFVDKHLEAEYLWQKKVLEMLTSNQIQSTYFKPGYLDLENKGYLKIQDLTCFINLNAAGSPCYKNKHCEKLFSRFCRAELGNVKLSYAGFMGALVKRT